MPEFVTAPQVDIEGPLTDMWRTVLLVVPKLLAFLVILLVGWLLATLLRTGVRRTLGRVGFDRMVARGGLGRVLARSRFDASDILARLAYFTVLLFTLQLAFGVWGPNPISDLISAVVGWLPKAAVAIIIVVVASAIASAVRDLASAALSGLSYGRLLAGLAAWFIIGLGAIAALNQVGIATTVTTPVLIAVLATVAGILIVGVGGGLVRPMQERWDRWLGRFESESAAIRDRAQAYLDSARARPADAAPDDGDPERTTVFAAGPAGPAPAPDGGDPERTTAIPAQGGSAEPAEDPERTTAIPTPARTADGEATQGVPVRATDGGWPVPPRRQ